MLSSSLLVLGWGGGHLGHLSAVLDGARRDIGVGARSLSVSVCFFLSVYLSVCLSLFHAVSLSLTHTHTWALFAPYCAERGATLGWGWWCEGRWLSLSHTLSVSLSLTLSLSLSLSLFLSLLLSHSLCIRVRTAE